MLNRNVKMLAAAFATLNRAEKRRLVKYVAAGKKFLCGPRNAHRYVLNGEG